MYLWQTHWNLKFHLNFKILLKILIHKEWSQTIWNCVFSDQNDTFRQNEQVFAWIFSNWIQQIFIGVKLSEFSKEIQTHFGRLAKFFVN